MHLNATILHADNLSEKTHLLLQTNLFNINVLHFHLTNLPALNSLILILALGFSAGKGHSNNPRQTVSFDLNFY